MQLVQITDQKIDMNNPIFGKKTLFPGKVYLTKDDDAQKLASRNWGRIIENKYRLSQLTRKELIARDKASKVLIIFTGGLGDAISVGILFSLLEKKYNFQIDACCNHDTWHYVLAPMGFKGKWLDYPFEIEILNKYDYIQTDITSFISDKTKRWEKCVMEELARAYLIDITEFQGNYAIPEKTTLAMKLPEGKRLRIGLNFESKGKVRNFPEELANILIADLIHLGFEIYRFGINKLSEAYHFPNNSYHDYSGRTDIFRLATLLKQMDFVVGMDSFIVHLSNILGVRTIALLSTTLPGIYRCHRNVVCIASQIECTPCGEIHDKCPLGHNECIAFYHQSISPEKIITLIVHETKKLLQRQLFTGQDSFAEFKPTLSS